ncbi:MAG: TonB C-terminal domain-containing protein [Tahibacter sp.]
MQASSTRLRVASGTLGEATRKSGERISMHASPEADTCASVRTMAWQLDEYLPTDAHVRLRTANGESSDLMLPQPFVPFVLLRYHSGAMIPVPVRIVAMDADLRARRVEVRLQSTFGMASPLRKIELRGIFAAAAPAPGETSERFAERTQATLNDLASCAPPRDRPIEPCADPLRVPNPLIFGERPNDNDALRREYIAKLQSTVQMNWLRPPSAKRGLHCTARATQNPDGAVVSVAIAEPCNADTATRKSIQRAVHLASPLPHEGYDEVFERKVDLVFRYDK